MSVTHRTGTIFEYRGIPVHAPIVAHEAALAMVQKLVPPGATVVDVGCGHGGMSQRLVDAGYHVIAIDTDVSEFAAQGATVVEGRVDDVAERVCKTHDVACVIALEVIEHTHDPVRFLASLQGLKTEHAVLSFPNLHEIHNHILFLRKGYFSWWNPGAYGTVGHRTIMVDWLLEKHCQEVGIAVAELNYIDRFSPSTPRAWLAYALARMFSTAAVPLDKRINGSVLARLSL